MYEWTSVVGINSVNIWNGACSSVTDGELLSQLIQSAAMEMSTDCQWTSPILIGSDSAMHTFGTQSHLDISLANHCPPTSAASVSVIDPHSISGDLHLSVADPMGDVDFFNTNSEQEKELRDRIMKHRYTSNRGFTSLQKRIERVKCDLLSLTNKLNTGHQDDIEDDDQESGYMFEDEEFDPSNGEEQAADEELENLWKPLSHLNSKNSFSELSERTQKVLGRLHLHNEESKPVDVVAEPEEEIQMEEDDLEFMFLNRQASFLTEFMSKGTLEVIDEQEEESDSSSDEESDSAKSTIIERLAVTADNSSTLKSPSSHSVDVTDTECFVTPISSFRVSDAKDLSTEDTDEYFSDLTKYSVSSPSSKGSIICEGNDKIEASVTESTFKPDQDDENDLDNDSSIREKSSSSIKGDEDFASEAEYDNSAWSTEDIPHSVEQSDSLYEKPFRSVLKASLPDLLESSDINDIDVMGGSLTARHFNKSTDLDEVLHQVSPYEKSSNGRLSQSLCNLFPTKSNTAFRPDGFFEGRASFDNLLETDLDSGYISVYKPVMETEILPKVDFSCSMGNVSHLEGSFNGFSGPLIDRLRKKAESTSELRIADSLSKLNLPNWLTLKHDDEYDLHYNDSSNSNSLPIQHTDSYLSKKLNSFSQNRLRSLPKDVLPTCNLPVIKPHPISKVILPSQVLRQSSQRKLTPIKVCQARQLLLPNKVTVNLLTTHLDT